MTPQEKANTVSRTLVCLFDGLPFKNRKPPLQTSSDVKQGRFTVFYIVELQNVRAYAPAERIEAKSLTSAMRVASRNKFFYGTALKMGDSVDSRGFIKNTLAVKVDGKWYKYRQGDGC